MTKEQVKENDVLDDEDGDEDEHAEGAESSEGEAEEGDEETEGEDGDADSDADPEPEIDPELEAKRKRRAEEKREKRRRQREAQERRDRELAESRRIISELQREAEETRAWRAQSESVALDQRLNQFQTGYDQANAAYADAISKGDGRAAVHYDRLRQDFASKYHEAAGLKQRVATQRTTTQPAPQTFDAAQQRAQSLAQEWAGKNSWWDPNGGDEDSVIVNAIDAKLAQEGYKPDSPAYWAELDRRVQRRLPERFKGRTGRSGPPMSGSRDGTSTGALPKFPRQVTDAWREAGYYDEPEKLKRVQKAYLASMKQASR